MTTARTQLPVEDHYDLARSLSLLALGRRDPTLRVDGPERVRLGLHGPTAPLAVECLRVDARSVVVTSRGPDAEWLTPAVAGLLGLHREHAAFTHPPRLAELSRALAGLRVPRVPLAAPRAVQIVLQQQVAFYDACVAWSGLVERFGTRLERDLWAPPSMAELARRSEAELSACGLLAKLARTVRAVAREARALEAVWDRGISEHALERTVARLAHLRGVGPWTLAMLRGAGLGDPDALVLGDHALPHQAAYFFHGRERGTDAELEATFEELRPHRFDAIALLWKSGIRPPRRGTRHTALVDRMGGRGRPRG